jgi:hypothetical protein
MSTSHALQPIGCSRHAWVTLLAVSLLAATMLGCEKPPYAVAPVSGVVTLNEKPAAHVAVMFQPVAPPGVENPGPGSFGITDEQGRYALKLVGPETPGAVVGKHKVRLVDHDPPARELSDDEWRPSPARVQSVPKKYNHALEAPFEFDVPQKGSTTADFKLTSP